MKNFPFILTILVASISTLAQVRSMKWQGDMCEYTGSYDSRKYGQAELRNTARLFTFGEFDLSYHAMVFKPEDIANLDVTVLDKDFTQKMAALKALTIVKIPYWETVRQRKIKELEQTYAFRRAQILAYRDPKVLRSYNAAPACNLMYVEPLISLGDSLFKVWLAVNMDSRSRNADPGRLKREFEARMASPDREKYALVEVMAFGWGNCANAMIQYDNRGNDGTYVKEFKKLFVRVRESCEEP